MAATVFNMPERLLDFTSRRPRGRIILAALVQRIWPLSLASYLVALAASPRDLPLYGFGSVTFATLVFSLTAATLFLSAALPAVESVTGASMALTTWSFMGRSASFALSDADSWERLLGTGVYVIITLAVVIIYFVHAAFVVDQRVRGDAAGT